MTDKNSKKSAVQGKRGAGIWRFLVLMIIVAGVAAAAFFHFDGMGRIEAWDAHRQAETALDAGDWPQAIRDARRATVLDPDSRRYVLTYEDAQRGFLLDLENRLEFADGPLERLRIMRESVHPLRGEFQDSIRDELRALSRANREQFLAWMESALDRRVDELAAALAVFHGADIREHFRDEGYARLQRIAAAGELVVLSAGQWQQGERLLAKETLAGVEEEYRRGAHAALRGRIESERGDVLARKGRARESAQAGRFLEARLDLLDLQEHADWIPAVTVALEEVETSGLEAYTAALVAAVLEGDAEKCESRLAEFSAFRGAALPLSVDDLLAPKTYDSFAAQLLEAGIMPGEGDERRHYLDVVLCAAVVDTYEDAENARQHVAAGYVEWARDMFDRGKYGNAAYLASIASELSPGTGRELYDESLRRIEEGLRIVVVSGEPANNSGERLNRLPAAGHGKLLPQVAERLPGAIQLVEEMPSPEPGQLLLPIQLNISVERLETSTDASTQMLSERYVAGSESVHNPQYNSAEQAVMQAQNRVQSAQSLLNQVRRTASMTASNNPFGAIANAAAVGAAEGDLRDAQNALRSAQQRLNSTPRTVSRDRIETFNYPRITHTVTIEGEGKLVFEGPFGASRGIQAPFRTSYQTVEVKGDPSKGVQSQLPQFRQLSQLEDELAQRWLAGKTSGLDRVPVIVAAVARESVKQLLEGSNLSPARRNDAELSLLLLTRGCCEEQDAILTSDRWTGVFGRSLSGGVSPGLNADPDAAAPTS